MSAPVNMLPQTQKKHFCFFLKERRVVGKIRLFPQKVMFCLFAPEFFWWYKTGRVLFTSPSVAGRSFRWCFLFLLLWFHTTGGWINGVFTDSDICIDTRVMVSDQRWVTREESGTELNNQHTVFLCVLSGVVPHFHLRFTVTFVPPHSSNVPGSDALGVRGRGCVWSLNVPSSVWV